MNRKFLVLGVLAALGGAAAVAGQARAASPYDGFYVGGSVGYQNWNNDTNNHTGGNASNGIGGSGGLLGADVGYGMTQGNLYLGGELDGDLSDNKGSTNNLGSSTSVENRGQASISLLPGVVVGNGAGLLFGRVGYAMGNERAYANGNAATKTLDGAVLGVGGAMPVAQNVDARVDLTHTWYGTNNFNSIGTTVTPQEDEAKVGLDYHF